MTERPILFNAEMVRAILDGRKTVTRRALKMPHGYWETSPSGELVPVPINCPYGQPGDRLWVRESWAADAQIDTVPPRDLSQGEPILYLADGAIRQTGCSMIDPGKNRPSIHMPRWASRILLEVTDVRVERLQDISEADAHEEGVDNMLCAEAVGKSPLKMGPATVCGYAYLWDKLGGAGSWDANPWVWVVEFKRIEQ